MTESWSLAAAVTTFVSILRGRGMRIGSGETRDALQALACIPVSDAQAFRLALRCALAKSREDQRLFDRLFDEFWRVSATGGAPVEADDAQPQSSPAEQAMAGASGVIDLPTSGELRDQADEARSSGASRQPRLLQRDFAEVDDAELDELRDLIDLIGKRLASRAGRRWRSHNRGRPDLRSSLRAALARGGEVFDIRRRKKRPQRLNLVVLADVSHSMDSYSRFFLQFIFAFQNLFRRMHTFVFSTRLSQVTQALRRGRLRQALDALPESVNDWAGGTRIGGSLHEFLRNHGDDVLGKHTVVMIISDGWDTGEPEELERVLRDLRARCRQIIWLDPLQDHPKFFASAQREHRTSRWVDHCLPARDLDSLRGLAQQLQRLPG